MLTYLFLIGLIALLIQQIFFKKKDKEQPKEEESNKLNQKGKD
jgi:hypothetical protein